MSNVSRKFTNLEALQKTLLDKKADNTFFSRRITLTRPDGTEINQVVWINNDDRKKLDELTEKVLSDIKGNKVIQRALIAELAEKILK